MKCIAESADGIDQEAAESHSRSYDRLGEGVKQWVEGDGNFIDGNACSDAGRFPSNTYT